MSNPQPSPPSKAQVERTVRKFLKQYDYINDLGIFGQRSPIYAQVPAEAMTKACKRRTEQARFLFPELAAHQDICAIVVPTVDWALTTIPEYPSPSILHRQIHRRATCLGASPLLAGQLADFLTHQISRTAAS